MLLGSQRLQVMSDKGNQQVARCRTKIRMAVLYVSHRLSNFSELLHKAVPVLTCAALAARRRGV